MKSFQKGKFLRGLGDWLKRLRQARGLGQDTLTEQAGLAGGTVSRIERGAVDPRTTTLVKLAHALNVPAAKVLEFEETAKAT